MMARRTFRCAGATPAAVVLLALTIQPVEAADEDNKQVIGRLEEVVVTAQRREQDLQDVPVAVTAFDENALEDRQIRRLEDIQLSVPSITIGPNTGASSAAKIFLRGLGEDESFFTADVPVGMYVDEVYIARQTGGLFDLYDIERIEVLRGPQGTLFGRNTTAGAIQLISRRPDPAATTFDADLTVGDYSRQDVRATVNVPLGERTALRVGGLSRQRDGWTRELNSGRDVNDQDVWGARASLGIYPSEQTDILVNLDYLKEDDSPGFAVGLTFNGVNSYPDFDDDLDGDGDPFTIRSDLEDPLNELETWGATVNIAHRFGDSTFKSITAYRELTNQITIDFDGFDGTGPGFIFGLFPAIFHVFQDQDQYQVSQEFQLQGSIGDGLAEYIAGVFLFTERNEQLTENGVFAPLGSPFNTPAFSTLTTDSYAAFVNADWHPSDRLRLTTGIRYTIDEKDFEHEVRDSSGNVLIATDPAVVGQPVHVRLTPDFKKVTGKIGVDYRLAGDTLLYGSISKGYKAGSFDGRRFLDQAGVINMEVIPEEDVLAYELGSKSDFWGGRARVNLALFLTEVDDLQGSGVVNNQLARTSVGDAEIKGAELEATFVPVQGLELSTMVSVMDTEVTKLNFDLATGCAAEVAGGLTLDGVELKEAPELTAWAGATYTWSVSALNGFLHIGADASYKDAYPTLNCTSRASSVVEHTVVNAQIGYKSQDGRYSVVLGGHNLTDEEYQSGQPVLNLFPTYTFAFMMPPRYWTLKLGVSF
jgi:iron complex outermembrane receptor protein